MKRTLLSLSFLLAFALTAVLMLPILATAALFTHRDPTCRLRGRLIRRYGLFLARACPLWSFEVQGDMPKDIFQRPYVVISNHESSSDMFALSFLPWDMRWIAKAELLRIPVMGWLVWLCGDIPVKRGDKVSVLKMLEACRETLRHGQSLMIFPEGTRSAKGQLGAFKDGAFQLALETGTPILPIALFGTRACWPKGALGIREAKAQVRILPPISVEGLTLDDLPAVREAAREAVAQAIDGLAHGQAPSLPSAAADSVEKA